MTEYQTGFTRLISTPSISYICLVSSWNNVYLVISIIYKDNLEELNLSLVYKPRLEHTIVKERQFGRIAE